MKTIFITGAANGIGLATAKHFAGLGWFVGLYDINHDGVQSLLDSGEFPHACGKHCDVTQRSSIKEALAHFGSHTNGRLDVLVNNAGVLSSGAFEDIKPEDHDLIIDINVKGLTTVAQEAFPLLKQTPGSTLVNLCSASSVHGLPLLAVYSASKFYVNGLTEALNIEWAQHDIRVTAVKPPIVNTSMGHAIDQRLTQRMAVDFEPEQIASAIEMAIKGQRVSYLLGASAKLWGVIDKFLPESGRRLPINNKLKQKKWSNKKMAGRLQNKVALVTGGGAGLGEATAKRFAEEGAVVVVTDLNAETATRVAEEINASGGQATARQQDVTDEALWKTVVDDIVSSYGALHILVNNAGIGLPGNAEEATIEDWRTTQAVNGESVFLGTRAAIGAMKESGGSIINISSIEGIVGEPGAAAYNYSKGGVRIFTKSAALHCASKAYPIRVNSVHPGFILTALVEQGIASLPDEMKQEAMQRLAREIPLGGAMGEPLDIANGCLFLASDESKYMTGSELVIDGGYTCH